MGYGTFGYALGDLVQTAPQGPVWQVSWQGWLLVTQANGTVRRQAVYRAGPYWDCYWEEELRAAFQGQW